MTWDNRALAQLSVRVEFKANGNGRNRRSGKFYDFQRVEALMWLNSSGFFSSDDFLNAAFKSAGKVIHNSVVARKARGII